MVGVNAFRAAGSFSFVLGVDVSPSVLSTTTRFSLILFSVILWDKF